LAQLKRLVKEEGVDVGARDLDKVTALHVAAYFGHCDVLRTLKELGAGYWRSEKEMRGNNDRDPFRPLSLEEMDVRSPPPHEFLSLLNGLSSVVALPSFAVHQRTGEDARRGRGVGCARGSGCRAGGRSAHAGTVGC
jgi:hypothetical protein